MNTRIKRLTTFLLMLTLMFGMSPEMSLMVKAGTHDFLVLLPGNLSVDEVKKRQVTFNDVKWYLIADGSTKTDGTEGTVTLLAADGTNTIFGKSKYSDHVSDYSTSTVKSILDSLTAPGGSFADVAYTIKDTDYGKLYLLSRQEAEAIPNNLYAASHSWDDGGWWLRSEEPDSENALIRNKVTPIYKTVSVNGAEYLIRPALQLDLSTVTFDMDTKMFSLIPYDVTVSGGSNAAVSGGDTSQTGLTAPMTSIMYTANEGYCFEEFSDITDKGITVKRTNDRIVTVSGRPTGNVSITVPDAIVKKTSVTEVEKPAVQNATNDKEEKTVQNPDTLKDSESTPDQIQTSDPDKDKDQENVDVKQKKTTLLKLKGGKKSITIFWKKQKAKGIRGYEIQYSTDRKFEKEVKSVSINKTKTTSKKIKKLKAKKKYFVRIRTFKGSGNKKTYSKWSSVKSVKTKK